MREHVGTLNAQLKNLLDREERGDLSDDQHCWLEAILKTLDDPSQWSDDTPQPIRLIKIGDLCVSEQTRQVWIGTRELELTRVEFNLLLCLAQTSPAPQSRQALLRKAWGKKKKFPSNNIDVYIRYLRAHVGSKRIRTFRGVGYALVDPSPSSPPP